MSERIDVMMPPLNSLPYFVVDTTGPLYVPIVYPAGPPLKYLITGDGKYTFAKGDNFVIMTCGLVMPLSFQLDRSNVTWPYIRFSMNAFGVTTGKTYILKEISGSGAAPVFYLPMENYDVSMDVFIDIQNQDPVAGDYLKNETFTIGVSLDLYLTDVSMVGVPAALNAKDMFVTPYVKILHNFALT
jgi:hypothetical protein